MPVHSAPRGAAQRGFILVTGLLFLVVMTMVALAMFRSTGLMERISANARDKQRAFEAAQSALQYGEWWLSANKPGSTTAACSTLANGDVTANIHVCTGAIQSDFQTTNVAWTSGFSYTPPNLTAPTTGTGTGGLVASSLSSDINYYNRPGFYLEFVAFSAAKGGNIYRVTAYGFGGSGNTMSVVRSTYLIPTTACSGTGCSGGGGGLATP